jgi:predicted anti-sigma-YlaC factor YlaD
MRFHLRYRGFLVHRKRHPLAVLLLFLSLVLGGGPACSLKKYAINKIGDTLASGDSVYETDEDVELVGEALPFGLKLTESLLQESPNHRGLLLTACRGFVLYSYGYVDFRGEVLMDEDIERGRELRTRARRLYLRGLDYCLRGIETKHAGFRRQLLAAPSQAAQLIDGRQEKWDLPFLYWTSASLGLAIAVSKGDASMLARLPEAEALIDRALELDEDWDAGSLHEFKVSFESAKPGDPDAEEIRKHYERALQLANGRRAALYVAYAEAIAVPNQNREQFQDLLQKALAVDPDADPENRLVNLLAQRRAEWLLKRIDELFL